jgi:hypothetical protein
VGSGSWSLGTPQGPRRQFSFKLNLTASSKVETHYPSKLILDYMYVEDMDESKFINCVKCYSKFKLKFQAWNEF